MGDVAQPAALKLLHGRGHGTDSGGRKVELPPAFRRIPPEPPDWLSEEAASEWKRVVPGLARLDILKEEDRAVLTAYCETWALFVEATRLVRLEGVTIEAKQGMLPHPAVAIARNAGRELRVFAAHFGLTPSTEAGLARSGSGDDGDNPFAG